MIIGYVQSGKGDKALKLFYQMRLVGMNPNPITMVNLLFACAHSESFLNGEVVDDFFKREEFDIDSFVVIVVIDMYAKCGSIYDAVQVFVAMP